MQAIMLAAGKGSRLGKYTKDNTKCMLEVNNKTLLQRCIEALIQNDIKKLVLVLGYKKDNVKKYIKEQGLDKKIEIIYIDNDDYDKTNNIYSLYLAKEYLASDDTLLMESDLIYDPSVINKIINSEYKDVATVAKYQQWMDGTVTIIDDENNIIEFIEKSDFDYVDIEKYYKTVNIYKFSKEYMQQFYLPFLEAYIKSYGKNVYYELVLKVISSIPKSGLKALKLNNEKWYEIDDCQDLDIATVLFSDNKTKLSLYQKRFGGYWRFEDLKDFCYLVNPYFPNDNMLDKMKYNFNTLIRQYPSGMKIQNNCMCRFFDVDENNILVGNGAAELINCLGSIIKGSIGITVPTFNEYVRCFPNNKIVKILGNKNDYKITKELLISNIDAIDNLIIINPDNPSGSFISQDDMLMILDKYNEKGKTVIFDESFIDFAEPKQKYTFLKNDILKKYKNLIVIKSISKSYGVPGLRLGVIASSNEELLASIKEKMPVWNINSFAEYFLQIFVPYKKEYEKSCEKIALERKSFVKKLSKIPYISVYDSQANYVMCKVISKFTSKDLCEKLLEDCNILIKDLSSKNGFEGVEMIRIAVKDSKSNEELISALESYIS